MHLKNKLWVYTVNSIIYGHKQELKKVSVSGSVQLRECPLIIIPFVES